MATRQDVFGDRCDIIITDPYKDIRICTSPDIGGLPFVAPEINRLTTVILTLS